MSIDEKIEYYNKLIEEKYKEFYEVKKKSDINKYNTVKSEIDKLYEKYLYYIRAKEKINEYVVNSNGTVTLLTSSEDLTGDYSIYVDDVYVGRISYRGYHVLETLGDIGYGIEKKYTGHNYAYQALCLLLDHLHKNGIDSVWIACYDYNIPSHKIIKKYGGTLIKKTKNSNNDYLLLYECKTRKLIKDNKVYEDGKTK